MGLIFSLLQLVTYRKRKRKQNNESLSIYTRYPQTFELSPHYNTTTTTTTIMKVNHRITKGVAYLIYLTFGHMTHIPRVRDIKFMCISPKIQLY